MERQPCQFLQRDIWDRLLYDAADALAASMGAEGEDLVFVDNATTGVNAVLKSLDLGPGDEILTTTHAYGAVADTVDFVAARTGARAVRADVPFPLRDADEVSAAVGEATGPATRVAVLDHVTSDTGLVFPIERLVEECHGRGVPVIVDGAHAPGMLDLDVPALGAEWYAGNCHKWLFAPKGCGFLWTASERQPETHPLVTSFGYGWDSGYRGEFLWTGTRDYTTYLAITEALAFRARLGEERVRDHQTGLAAAMRDLLAAEWGVDAPAPAGMEGAMAVVPLPGDEPATYERRLEIMRELWERHGVEVAVTALAGRLWVRVSAAPYNDLRDAERLAAAVL